MNIDYQQTLREEFEKFSLVQQNKYPDQETLKIDLHCHDFNSDVPDELIGRILNVPETWLPSKKLIKKLKTNGCTAFTITNHNNARSCYALQDKGQDILTAAEFSCWVPDFEIGIHVLAYGFTPEQEVKLEHLRKNLYHFLEYAHAYHIPTIWAHPLYHYSTRKTPEETFFRKMLLVFERFEVLNGQRDTCQNLLVKEWLEQVSNDEIDRYAKEFGIDPLQFCSDPYRKSMTGGSDSHMGIFAGMTGTCLYVPGLQSRLKSESSSQLALEAIRNGNTAPFGTFQNAEKMTIAFLDYACQIALNYKDPGLVRMLLHKGSTNDKLISFVISNLFSEVQQHKVTSSFIKVFHDSMMGEKPSFLKKIAVKPVYKPIFNEAVHIAGISREKGQELINGYYHSILEINKQLYSILAKRLEKKLKKSDMAEFLKEQSVGMLIEKLELPISIRSYINDENKEKKKNIDISGFLDGLSFPFFGSALILAAHFTSAKVMFNTRPLIRDFSKRLGKFQHPQRILWLTDTFGENNGISVFLKEMLDEIKQRDLPIDILTCSSTIQSEEHLVVMQPVREFTLPIYNDYPFKVPDFVELHNLFLSGGYDRIICSTEGIMGLCGLYLKHAYTVEASFYMHTDWLMFARKVLNIEGHNLSRIRRMLRFFYNAFDRVLVLNSDQKKWLSGTQMNLAPDKVHQTAHWVSNCFKPGTSKKETLFSIPEAHPVLLYVGRLSKEKGVLELKDIYKQVKQKHNNTKLVIVGKGPALQQLRNENPDALFIDWVNRDQLPEIYSSADMLILPSRFDTFSNVVLEALSCGLPVIAYNTKGPKDIIRDGKDGFLVNNQQEMCERICEFLHADKREPFGCSAIERATAYNPGSVITGLMKTIGLNDIA